MSEKTDLAGMYFASGDSFDAKTIYTYIPDNEREKLRVICGGDAVTVSWCDLFKLLVWACENIMPLFKEGS